MAQVYVANATKYVHNFTYNIRGRAGATVQSIPMGGQVELSGDLTPDDIEGIVLQQTPYGFCSLSEVESNTTLKKFSGIFYSIGKPIPAEKIRRAMERFTGKLVELGKEIRKEAAVALNNQITNEIIGEDNTTMSLTNLEMTIEEQPPAAGMAEGQSLLEEGIRVSTNPKGRNSSRGGR